MAASPQRGPMPDRLERPLEQPEVRALLELVKEESFQHYLSWLRDHGPALLALRELVGREHPPVAVDVPAPEAQLHYATLLRWIADYLESLANGKPSPKRGRGRRWSTASMETLAICSILRGQTPPYAVDLVSKSGVPTVEPAWNDDELSALLYALENRPAETSPAIPFATGDAAKRYAREDWDDVAWMLLELPGALRRFAAQLKSAADQGQTKPHARRHRRV